MFKSYTLTASIFDATDICASDHNPIIAYFDYSFISARVKIARARQLKRNKRRIFKLDSVTSAQWEEYTLLLDSLCDILPHDFNSWHLNRKCEYLQTNIIKFTLRTLPNSQSAAHYSPKVPKELETLTQDYRFVTKVLHILRILSKRLDSFSYAHEAKWTYYQKRLSAIFTRYKDLLEDTLPLPSLLAFCIADAFITIISDFTHISQLLWGFHILQEKEFQMASISANLKRRNDKFEHDISSFINSALSRTQRRITLDRVFIEHETQSRLLTHPDDINEEVVNHFQNFVLINTSYIHDIASLPDR